MFIDIGLKTFDMVELYQVVGKSFPNLAILSLIGNPFHKELEAPVQVALSFTSLWHFLRHTHICENQQIH